MSDADDKELEQLAIENGEINPEKYSRKNAGCLFVVLGVIGFVAAVLKLLAAF